MILQSIGTQVSNNNEFTVEVIKEHKHTAARVLKISTPHGEFLTPTFMPVGTKAAVNSVNIQELVDCGSQIILGGNTYHMLCDPGMDILQQVGGMHKFMSWHGPMLTDSGGFQVFSLSKNSQICKIDEQGAKFKHPVTGKVIVLNPVSSIQAQKIIGADIIMAFDQCTPNVEDQSIVHTALERTHRWLQESIAFHKTNVYSAHGYKQALFGIIQGGLFKDLRIASTEFVVAQDLDGVAIGGETIGYDMDKTHEVLNWIMHLIPKSKPRYTMGVGLQPSNLIDVVRHGVDMFDCVAPTRNARHGALYHGYIVRKNNWIEFVSEHNNGRIDITKKHFATDNAPILEDCQCYTCKNYSRAYLHFLIKSKSPNYSALASIHNIHIMHKVCNVMREEILGDL